MTGRVERPRRGEYRWWVMLRRMLIGFSLAVILLVVGIVVVLWTAGYSDGERVGYLQKFSHKGWLCKTYEGELAMTTVPGVAPVLWRFSVADDAVAAKVNDLLGRKVVVHYHEYRAVPSCFGETNYFVDVVEEATE